MSRGGRHGCSLRIQKSYWLFDTENKNHEMGSSQKKPKKGGKQIQGVSRKSTSSCTDNKNRYETDSKSDRQSHNVKKPKRTDRIELKNYHETDSDRKRKGSEINGPPNKKLRKDNPLNAVRDNSDLNQTVPQSNENEHEKSPIFVIMQQPRVESSDSINSYNRYINSVMFDDLEGIGSEYDREATLIRTLFNDIENVPSDLTEESNESPFFTDILNIFDDVDQYDENDEDRVIITEIFDDDEKLESDKTAN